MEELEQKVREELAAQRSSCYSANDTPAWVVVLSAPHTVTPEGTIEDNVENMTRVLYGVALVREIAALRLNMSTEEVDNAHLLEANVPLVINGESEQLYALRRIAYNQGNFPKELIKLVNSGDRGESHTGTQFQVMEQSHWFRYGEMIVVTSGYHVPRVRRTAKRQFPSGNVVVVGVPFNLYSYGIEQEEAEVERILRYVAKGDIAADPY